MMTWFVSFLLLVSFDMFRLEKLSQNVISSELLTRLLDRKLAVTLNRSLYALFSVPKSKEIILCSHDVRIEQETNLIGRELKCCLPRTEKKRALLVFSVSWVGN